MNGQISIEFFPLNPLKRLVNGKLQELHIWWRFIEISLKKRFDK
nr:MAG TPA: hypothetical protein [Caudoviricetes sp.]